MIVARKVEDGTADDYVSEVVAERHGFNWFSAEVGGREVGGEGSCDLTYFDDCGWIGVYAEDLVAGAKKIDQIAAGATTCVKDAHAGSDAACQELIEEIDIDLAELGVEVSHGERSIAGERVVDVAHSAG